MDNMKKNLDTILNQCQDPLIALNTEGIILAANAAAEKFAGTSVDKIIEQPWTNFVSKNEYSILKNIAKAVKSFNQALKGIPSFFIWEIMNHGKPTESYEIILSQVLVGSKNEKVICVRILDILQRRIVDWVLKSMAKMNHDREITSTIDQLLIIAIKAFNVDYGLVQMFEHQNVYSVSFYDHDEKQQNISYSLHGTPVHTQIKQHKKCHFSKEVQNAYPEDDFLNKHEIEGYLSLPIFSSDKNLMGAFTLMSKDALDINSERLQLIELFTTRISIEVERLLSLRKLKFLASIPQQDPNPILRIQPDGKIIYSNKQGKLLVQHWQGAYKTLPPQLIEGAFKALNTGHVIQDEITVADKNYLFSMVWMPSFNHINLYGSDVSRLKIAEENTLNLARIDSLTEVANRQYFEEQLSRKMAYHQLHTATLGILLIDLDNFRSINDTLGHSVGDRLLRASARRMKHCLRDEDFLARLGGDEFVIILDNANVDSSVVVSQKLNEILAKPFQFGEYNISVSCSIGIAFFPESGDNANDLLHHADIAKYQAKNAGKNRYEVYAHKEYKHIHKLQSIIRKDLNQASSKNQLFINYQPQYNIKKNTVIGFEALVRWKHPKHGLVPPDEFIAIAEHSGLIHNIGQWIIEQAIADFGKELGINNDTKLSVNVSLSQLSDPRFLDGLTDMLKANGLAKERLVLDIPEDIFSSKFIVIDKLIENIHRCNIKICLDNFGGSNASLSRLIDFPVDYIKLDKSLIKDLASNKRHQKFLKGILMFAQNLDIEAIPQGVETKEQGAILQKIGYTSAQGFYYSEPKNLEELKKILG